METTLIRAAQLLLSLAILVFLHEVGHFFFARLFKTRVDKFYLFFNPRFSLLRAKKIKGKWQFRFFAPNVPLNERQKKNLDGSLCTDVKGKPVMEPIPLSELPDDDWRKYPENTEWGIGWLPLGGYCKIAGMIDESMDTAQLASEPQDWEYRAKPTWQRMFIISGGVLVNFLLAMVIYSAVLFTWGMDYIPLRNAQYGLQFSPSLLDAGFRNGDNILAIDGEEIDQERLAVKKILIEGARDVRILREGQSLNLTLPEDLSQNILANNEVDIISLRYPFVVGNVLEGSPASQAALQAGDSLVGINGKEVSLFQEIAPILAANKNATITVDYSRNGELRQTTLTLNEDGKLGVGLMPLSSFFTVVRKEYSFFESIPAGIALGWQTLTDYVKQFKVVFTKEGAKQIGGFGSIGKLFSPVWNWHSFWMMTALLSVILAFMNFLPIPALDGGHFVFLLYEMITRRKPSEKVMEYAQMVGFMLLIALLFFANGNDLYKAIFK